MEVIGQYHTPAALPLERTPVLIKYENGLDGLAEEKNLLPLRDSNPGPSSP
jgi:hypothetical protein